MYRESIKQFFYNYDNDATTFKYGRLGGPAGYSCPGSFGAKTTGSTTTVDAVAGTPFDPLRVGDVLVFRTLTGPVLRRVATKVSGAQITVDTAIDLGAVGVFFDFYPWRIGAAATDGWHHVQMYDSMTVFFAMPTVAATGGVAWQIEGRAPSIGDPAPFVLELGTQATAGSFDVPISASVSAIRVGVRGVSDFTGTDSVSVWVAGDMRT